MNCTQNSEFGRQVIDEMARIGMVMCCSHAGYRSAMQVMEYSNNPVIFSHSNTLALQQHPRNIPDELIRACAQTGGAIGVNGIGLFLADNDAATEQIVRHIDYISTLVGPEHVSLGIDYAYDQQEMNDYIRNNPKLFPTKTGYSTTMQLVVPEQIPEIGEQLLERGYSQTQVNGILGNNLVRIAEQVWR